MLHITIHFLFYAPRPIAPLARYSEFLSSQIDDISPFQRPASPMQIYTITHEPPHSPLPNHVQPPPNCSMSATEPLHCRHRAAPFIYETAPILHCFCHIPVKKPLHTYPPSPNTSYETPHISPPLPDNPRTHCPTSTHLYLTTYARTAPPLRTFTHQLTHEPPHICAPSPLLCVHFPKLLWEITPPQRTFTRQSTQKQPHAHALTTSLLVPTCPSQRTFIKRPMYVCALFH